MECEVADALAVLDALAWERAWVVGHSWGGHLLLHLAVAAPGRLLGGLAVEPLGGTGDGGLAAFEAEMSRRIPEGDRRSPRSSMPGRCAGRAARGGARQPALAWPAYFASPGHVMPFRETETSVPAYAGLFESLQQALPRLASELAGRAGAARVRRRDAQPDALRPGRRRHRPRRPGAGWRSFPALGTSRGSNARAASAARCTA